MSETNSLWISIKNESPEKGERVLCSDGENYYLAIYEGSNRWFEGIFYGDSGSMFSSEPYPIYSYPKITHWIHLPKLPDVKLPSCGICQKQTEKNGLCKECKERIRKESLNVKLEK